MSIDRNKVLQNAQKLLTKGQYDRAIAEYRRLVEDDPRDVRTWLKIGDLYTRKGSNRDACETYERVAEHYAAQGFFSKAVAVYKQILKLEPNRLDTSLRLAQTYEHLELVSDAVQAYEALAVALARSGDIERGLEMLSRMVTLDPENLAVRIKYAEALSKSGKTDRAADEFAKGAKLLQERGRLDDFVKVAERLLYHRPNDVATARDLASVYLEKSDAKRALAKLQLAFKANPRDVATLDLLARAFEQLGQKAKAISVYREMARIYHDGKRPEERARVLKHILDIDPSDAEARQALASYAPSSRPSRGDLSARIAVPDAAVVSSASVPPRETAAPVLEIVADEDDEDVDAVEEAILFVDETSSQFEIVETLGARASLAEPEVLIDEPAIEIEAPQSIGDVVSRASQLPRTSVPPEIQREAQVARLLTECDVFARYGLKDKVIRQLEEAILIAPEHVEARKRLAHAYNDSGRRDDAIAQWLTLARIARGTDREAMLGFYREAYTLDPTNEEARTAIRTPDAPTAAFLDAGGDEPTTVEHLVPEPPTTSMYVGDFTSPDAIVDVPSGEVEALPDEDEFEDFGGLDAASPPAPTPAPAAPAPKAPVTLDAMSPAEFDAVPVRPSLVPEQRAEAERFSKPAGDIEETLDEVDFFIAQGLWEEAHATVTDALTVHVNHRLLIEKLNEILEAMPAEGEGPVAPSDESFALAEKLAEELAAEPVEAHGGNVLDVENVFEQFKRGVEQQVPAEDSDTHFDLGIAYKEMGLLDDAVHEFELAMASPDRECIAQTMVGLCLLEQRRTNEAITRFKKGLYAERRTEREELGLYFELGAAYELLGDMNESLYYFEKVRKKDASFRGVEPRIRALQNRANEPERKSMTQDDVDQAFDDLVGKE